jgi:hypothetical protein
LRRGAGSIWLTTKHTKYTKRDEMLRGGAETKVLGLAKAAVRIRGNSPGSVFVCSVCSVVQILRVFLNDVRGGR